MPSRSVFQKSHGMGRVQHKDSTVCTVSVCVCVTSGSDVIPSHFHPRTHTLVSAVCHWIKHSFSCRLSAATSARTHSDRHFCLFCRCCLASLSCGSDPTLDHHCAIVYFLHESVGWMTRSAQIPGQFWCLSEASLFYLHLWRSTETSKHQINSFAVRFAQTFMIL